MSSGSIPLLAGWPDNFNQNAQGFRQKPQVLAQTAFFASKLGGKQKSLRFYYQMFSQVSILGGNFLEFTLLDNDTQVCFDFEFVLKTLHFLA